MVKSGIMMDSEVKNTYIQLSKRKISAFRFMINGTRDKIIVEEGSILPKSHTSPYTTIMNSLEDDKCRYVACNFAYKDAEGKEIEKVIIVMWVSDSAKVKDKMSLASSIAAIKSELGVGEGNVFEMHGPEDKSIDTVLRRFASGKSTPVACEGKEVVYCENEAAFKFA